MSAAENLCGANRGILVAIGVCVNSGVEMLRDYHKLGFLRTKNRWRHANVGWPKFGTKQPEGDCKRPDRNIG